MLHTHYQFEVIAADENKPKSTNGKDDRDHEYVVHDNAEELERRRIILDRINRERS